MPGWDERPRAGSPDGDPYELPVDLAAVQADDALLDMIGAGYTPRDTDDELTQVLAAWRRDAHAEPIRELVDTTTAMAVIRAAARQPARRRNPVFGSAAAVAALLVIAFSATGLVAKSAQPGDHLWGMTQVLYSDYARSVETAAAVRTELNDANAALKQNNPARARAALQRVQQQLPVIGEAEGRTDLIARHRQLEQRLLTGAPDTGSANLPGNPFPSSVPTGPGATANRENQSRESTAPAESTTTSESTTSTPTPTPNSNQFFPRRPYPYRPYYPSPGASPGDSARNGEVSGNGGPGNGADSGNGSSTGATTGSATPSTSPSPGGSHVYGRSPGSGFRSPYPYPPGNGFRCEHPTPQPPYCG